MVAEGDHFAVDLDSADTASGHAAMPDPHGQEWPERMKPPATPGGGLRHAMRRRLAAPLMISGHHSLILVHGSSTSSAVPLTCPKVAACNGHPAARVRSSNTTSCSPWTTQ